jgi:diguanylate cyclase (GGDEF)-like protein/PAS domain S-box-containing protein/putative nucleotidyltransferase with HDIG domain
MPEPMAEGPRRDCGTAVGDELSERSTTPNGAHASALPGLRTSTLAHAGDTNEHECAADASRRGEAHFRALVERASDLIAVVDGDGVRTYASPGYHRVLGYRPQELVGRPIEAINHPDDAERDRRFFADLAQRPGAVDRFEARVRHQDGSTRWLEVIATNRLDDPDVRGIVVNSRDVTERKKAEAAARQHADAHAALLRVSQAVVSGRDLPTVLAEAARAALGVAGVEGCSVDLWHPETNEMIVAATETVPDWPGVAEKGHRYALADRPTSRTVLEVKEPLGFAIDDPAVPEHERRGSAAAGIGSVLLIPLLLGEECLGTLNLYARRPRLFPSQAVRFGLDLAAQTSQAIDRMRLAEAERRQRAHTAALLRVAAALNEAGSLGALMPTLAAVAAEAIGVDCAEVHAYDGASTGTVASGCHGVAYEPELTSAINGLPPGRFPAEAEVIRTRRPLFRGVDTPFPPPFPPPGRRTDLVVPLVADGMTQGVLYVWETGRERLFTEDEVALLEAIGHQAGLAILRTRDAAAAERRADHLALLNQVGRALSSSLDLKELCAIIHAEVSQVLAPDAFWVTLVGEGEEAWSPYSAANGRVRRGRRRRVTDVLIRHVVRTHQSSLVTRADDPLAHHGEPLGNEARRVQSALHVPMLRGDELIGVLSVQRYDPAAYCADDLRTLETIAEQAAAAIRNAELLARNRELYLGSVAALASAVDAKDPSTRGHSERVSWLAGRAAELLGMDRGEAETVELAGLLHDVGKIGVPDAILQKPGPLDDAERAIMVGHAALGAEILAAAGAHALRPLVPLVRHHHERVDGRGYPDALAGDAIPLGAAIIAAADAFDTMVTARPYRPARPLDQAVAELHRTAGSQFRLDVVAALAQVAAADSLSADILPDPPVGGDPGGQVTEQDPGTPAAGQMGDTRALGLLVELATATRHIPNLQQFLGHVAGIVQRRLGYQDVMLLLVDRNRGEIALAAHSCAEPSIRPDHRQALDVGVLGEVIRTSRPRNVPDVSREPRYHSERSEPRGSELAVPLIAEGEPIGVINVESDRVAAFTAGDEAVLTAVAGQLAAAIQVAQLHDEAKRAAATDGLTGLANHRAFYDALTRATATERLVSVVLLDVEGLKQVNDAAGHLAGDALLRRVARVIRDNVRAADVVARYGGDEFGVVMSGVDSEEASCVAARVRQQLLAAEADGAPCATVRYGVATLPEDGARATDLVAVADRRLYHMRGRFEAAGASWLGSG